MLTDDEVIEHTAMRLICAIEMGGSRTALDVFAEWKDYLRSRDDHAALHARLRETMRSMMGTPLAGIAW